MPELKTHGDSPAFAAACEAGVQTGLTKREYIAIECFKALLSRPTHFIGMGKFAVAFADRLIEALNA